ncbi:MAG TPA: HEAT repeat domain-containing protein, partial [Rhizomicrobium sp.]|nr:HEAT repeat domain-containing protein [Rhizomicrobium sp.]
NVMIAIGNSGDAGLAPSAERALQDKSALVRGAAVWALSRLLSADAFTALSRAHAAAEPDAQVRSEWIRE